MLARREESDFQILAHFAKRRRLALAAHLGGRAAELAAEGVGEVAVAGEAEFEGERGKIAGAVGQAFERRAQAQAGQIAMHRHAGSLLKDAGEMKRRRVHGTGNVVERDALAQTAREISLGGLGPVGVIGVGAVAPALARQTVSRERGFKHVGDELQAPSHRPRSVRAARRRQPPAAARVRGAARRRRYRTGR